MGEVEDDDDDNNDDERTSQADHKSMWQCFRLLRVKHQKDGLNGQLIACTKGGGASVLAQHLVAW